MHNSLFRECTCARHGRFKMAVRLFDGLRAIFASTPDNEDLLLFAKRNPGLFIELVEDDNVQLRNFGIKATEANIIRLSQDQRSFHWASNDKKLMSVPFDENPYSALAAYFKTDEGTEVYKSIEKKLK